MAVRKATAPVSQPAPTAEDILGTLSREQIAELVKAGRKAIAPSPAEREVRRNERTERRSFAAKLLEPVVSEALSVQPNEKGIRRLTAQVSVDGVRYNVALRVVESK